MTATTPTTSTPEERKKKYKKSLNLPKTSFPMKANLTQNEAQTRKRWQKAKLFDAVAERRAADENPYVFHDGPPYANGSIHVGHLLNKVLKDIVVRSRNMAGQNCVYVPGWDCHGLPIEHKVMKEMTESGKIEKIKDLDEDTRRMAIRRECQKYAAKYQKIQSEQLQRLLTHGDYADPYLTMKPGYEKSTMEVFADLVEQGLVYRALKPVHWSIANQTALAEAELEYEDRIDPSIYVDFEADDVAALAAAFGVDPAELDGPRKAGFMIWTTTPWTLPANLMIAVHPRSIYRLVRLGDRVSVLAGELAPRIAEIHEHTPEVLAEARGEALLGLEYAHPFCDRKGKVVGADYVTLEDGTGLVHTAPGHGAEDFMTGRNEGMEVYCPVRDDGTYDDSVPEWIRGLSIWDANPKIIEHIRESGHLYHHFDFSHSYPHDWRSKTPVIFRCTEQWFIAVDEPTRRDDRSLRDMALAAAENDIRFVPGWGVKRLRGMLEARPDWCISRQRSWGLPIPAFRRADGSVFLTAASSRAVAAAFGREDADEGGKAVGSDAWFTKDPEWLLKDYDPSADPDAPDDLDVAELKKMYDIIDVWFESGSSWSAVMRARGLGFPTDLYLEGSDQHRGWFQASLLPALGATGQAPFRTLLTHGFMVDKEGKKMSKSLGNALQVDDLLKKHGADVCRFWVSSLAFDSDIKVDPEYFVRAGESYRKVRNTLRFLLSNLNDYDGSQQEVPATSLDAWALERTAQLRRDVIAAYHDFEFRTAHLLLFDFCNETMSAVYLDAVKDRLYCDRPDAPRRRRCQSTLDTIAQTLIHLLAPIMPHTADEAWRALRGQDAESVHLGVFPEVAGSADDDWPKVMEVRERALKMLEEAKARGIENRADAGLVLPDPEGLLQRFEDDLVDIFGVSRVSAAMGADAIEIMDLRNEPRCERSWRRDGTVRQREDGGWLSDRDADAAGVA